MTKLVDDEIEEDDEFWNQDALKEEEDDTNYVEEGEVADVFDSDFDEDEEDDTNYVEEGEVADVFDSDFDEDEPEPEEEAENEPDERLKTFVKYTCSCICKARFV
ncbi:hypothetical protein M8C21_024574 [Ambrosia artemisiifolia]|uniref:Uncharacterized protein n=1 Tax=Ambrosia artemisiifolia TaxID=4212 RepID=A0AAD5BTJ2_AMBAR|nr:hypothetical protein M8C21_024574 [Ambrosia artemisiifolia]